LSSLADGPKHGYALTKDVDERPHSPRRTLDVMRGGISARLAAAGTGGHGGITPGGVAAFPAAEVAWMAVSPLALVLAPHPGPGHRPKYHHISPKIE
jgi:hypothetical protein